MDQDQDIRYTWSRMSKNPIEHIAGGYPTHQPICGTQLSVRTQTFGDRPSGYAQVCARCQTRQRALSKS